ncbi:MAG: DUF1573 domain-containing protein [Verrucomicrobiota bacterium]|nr:DUF1573 domain-containing protein [Verrucomicrobiota bacterium]
MNLQVRALFGALFFSAALASANAQLTWEKSEVELHPKAGAEEAVAQFRYTNKGDKPIKITNVRTSCGCTVATLKKNDVAPGESGEVTATLKIGGRTGMQQKIVTVETDDPSHPSFNLILKADVAQALEIQPPFVSWNAGEEPKAKTITVKAAKDIPITKIDVAASTPEFVTKVEKGSGAGEFKIDVTPKSTTTPLNGTLTIKSDYPQAFYATMRVMPGNTPQ